FFLTVGLYSDQMSSMLVYFFLVFLPVMYGIIFAVGLLGNLTSIIIYVVRLRPWKINSVIMVNLALADLQYVLSLPFLVHYYITEDWSFSDAMCRAVRFGFHFNLYCSILFLACLSVCRYVVVVHPLRAVQMQRKRWAVVVCLAVWLIALLEVTPMVFMLTVEKTANNITLTSRIINLSLSLRNLGDYV
uniref:G-protein coupled receptors family 1 profile domain-containing protein n=1 Tax=Esox lucius TaxID=8010 RepID=A0A3P8ZEQ0_ESOLU